MTMMLSDLPKTNAIRIGSIFHKSAAIHELLNKSVRLLAYEHRFEGESTFSIGGSCTLLSYEQQAFVVTTRHQLNVPSGCTPSDDHFEALRITTSNGGYMKNILVDRCYFEENNIDQEYHDLIFLKVHDKWLENSADRGFFFPVQDFSSASRRLTYFYGHPSSRNEIRYDPLHVFIRTAYIDGFLESERKSHADYIKIYSYYKSEYEVNGFSGGAAFSLIGDIETELEIILDGIIVRGGSGTFFVVDSSYLKLALSKFM